jgi:hypothetical protein
MKIQSGYTKAAAANWAAVFGTKSSAPESERELLIMQRRERLIDAARKSDAARRIVLAELAKRWAR